MVVDTEGERPLQDEVYHRWGNGSRPLKSPVGDPGRARCGGVRGGADGTVNLIFRDVNEVPGELVGRVQVSRGLGVVQRGGELKKVFLRRLHLSSGVMALWPSGWTSGGSGV